MFAGKFLRFLAIVALLAAGDGLGQTVSPITSVEEARGLSKDVLANGIPIRIEAVVLAHHLPRPLTGYSMLFVHDGDAGIFANAVGMEQQLPPGTRVRVTGNVVPGDFAPAIGGGNVEFLGMAELPPARPASFDDLLSGKEDSQWVRISGIICAVSLVNRQLRFELAVGTRELPVYVAGDRDSIPPEAELVDAMVTVTGAGITGFNPRGQILSAIMMVPSLDMIEMESPPPPLAEIPERSIDGLLTFKPEGISGHRVKVRGIVTHCDSKGSVYLTHQDHSLRALTKSAAMFEPGTMIEAIGFPKPGLTAPVLDYSAFRKVGEAALPQPVSITHEQAISGDYEAALVRISGRLVEQTIQLGELRMLMENNDAVFPATLSFFPGEPVPPLEIGSHLDLTGIALTEGSVERRGGVGFRPTAWHLNLRNPADIRIVRNPDWWNMHRILSVLAALAVILFATFLWIGALRRRVSEQTAVIQEQTQREATLEERNRIARELHDTLAQGFAGTAFTLEGIASMLQNDSHPVRSHVELALKMVRHSLTEARRSVMNLRSEALECRDLASALDETARNLVESSAIELTTDLKPLPFQLSGNQETNLFRIGVEAVTNAIRHGAPDAIHINLGIFEDALRLEVTDDGNGFDSANPPTGGHFGLLGMRERAKLIQADLQIVSQPGAGTRIVVTLPLAAEAAGPPARTGTLVSN